MIEEEKKKKLHHPFEPSIENVTGYNFVLLYFGSKDGWVQESIASWSTNRKVARIQPDGQGHNFEVWEIDPLPQLTYCQKLEVGSAEFDKQAADSGI